LNKQTQHYSDDRRKPAIKTGLAKVAVQCSVETFVVDQSLVLRINICAEKPKHRKSENRYAST
jgi:hypothetical protein